MESITIGQIVAAIAILTAIIGFCKLIVSFIKTYYTNVINGIRKHHEDDINGVKVRLTVVEKKVNKLDNDVVDSKEERFLLMGGVLACLKGLQEQGCNHSVTTTIAKLEEYMAKKAHE